MNMEKRKAKSEKRTDGAWRAVLGALAVGLVLSSVAQTNTNSAASENSWPSFDSFNVIEHNNIFDPNRRPYFQRPQGQTPPRMEGFALRGTMSYKKGKFAVFAGGTGSGNDVPATGSLNPPDGAVNLITLPHGAERPKSRMVKDSGVSKKMPYEPRMLKWPVPEGSNANPNRGAKS